jgi:L-alanine-DL-glutamate epimerase-like enolase superfamily enzyme
LLVNFQETLRKRVKITDLKAMVVHGNTDWNLVKIETDSGVTGIGEAYWGRGVKDVMLGYLRQTVVGEGSYFRGKGSASDLNPVTTRMAIT